MQRGHASRIAFVLLVACVASACAPIPTREGPGYKSYLVGNPADVVRPTQGLLVLQGGGDDVDENYVRMGELGGGGDFVVMRASGADDYNEYIFDLCKCDSVETLVFDDRQASQDPYVIDTIRNAEAIFIAGGDQSRYVRFWKDSPVEDAINFVIAKPAPIGGTSAGMAVMGEFLYSAMSEDSLTSEAALADPWMRDVTLDRDFLRLPKMGGIMTDQHLHERDRMGRTITLLARLVHDGWTKQGRAIAADRETALHVDPATGVARVYGTPAHPTPFVYFLSTPGPPEVCAPGTPLSFRNIAVYRLGPGDGRFYLDDWRGEGGTAYTLSVETGVLSSSRGEVY